MLAVVQSVLEAAVSVDNQVCGQIEKGMLVYFGVGAEDDEALLPAFLDRILKMRIFKDAEGKMNLDLKAAGGDVLLVSQFTLYGDVYHGHRPGFDAAARPDKARELYEKALDYISKAGYKVQSGIFGAHMMVSYTNDGPETFIVDSAKMKQK